MYIIIYHYILYNDIFRIIYHYTEYNDILYVSLYSVM